MNEIAFDERNRLLWNYQSLNETVRIAEEIRTHDAFGGSQDVTFVRSVFPKNAMYHATVELLCSDGLSCIEFFTSFSN